METKKLRELYSWVNFSYVGIIAGVLSVVVSAYNINRYYEEIKKAQNNR